MKRTVLLILTVLVVLSIGAVTCCAQNLTAQISALEMRANLIQQQIDKAKVISQANLDRQIQAANRSIDHLLQQRDQIDAQVTGLQGQVAELKKRSQANLGRQIGQYNKQLDLVKSQLTSAAKRFSQKASPKTALKSQVTATQRKVNLHNTVGPPQTSTVPKGSAAQRVVPSSKVGN
ncbi:hypothetical protein ACFL2Q_06500 [Thermodesulfobacteriota bacterium]